MAESRPPRTELGLKPQETTQELELLLELELMLLELELMLLEMLLELELMLLGRLAESRPQKTTLAPGGDTKPEPEEVDTAVEVHAESLSARATIRISAITKLSESL